MKKWFLTVFLLLSASVSAQFLSQKNNPENKQNYGREALFEQYKNRIVQVRAINRATGQKGSIGSGFVIGDGALVATNYHVISALVIRPGFEADYLDQNFQQANLKLVAVDVINDLAILQAEKVIAPPLKFANENKQGEALFSLGNPGDYGFVIVEGSHNGMQQNTAYPRILFTGAINSGMSGGPTLNQYGEVVGINVATQGNGLGFIIPVDFLKALHDEIPKQKDFKQALARQIAADNENYYQRFLEKDFKSASLNRFVVPTEFGEDIRCWDSSEEPELEDLIAKETLICGSDRELFLNNDFRVGQFFYQYDYFYAREALPMEHFYNLYSKQNRLHYLPQSSQYYGDFDCRADFINLAGSAFKATYCRRPLRQYENLFDISLTLASLDKEHSGFMIKFAFVAIQEELAQKIINLMMKKVKQNEQVKK